MLFVGKVFSVFLSVSCIWCELAVFLYWM